MNPLDEYKYFRHLIKINNKIFSKQEDYNIRLYSAEPLKCFEDLLANFYTLLHNTNDFDIILLSLLEITGKLLYYQPFYDGNSRTLKQFIREVLTELGYQISFNNDDYIIPMLFDGEKCTAENVIDFKQKTNLKKLSI